MPFRALFFRLLATVLLLCYPFVVRWMLPHWPTAPGILLMLPPTLLNGALAWLFGRTLLHGREPMISTFARIERARLNQREEEALPEELAKYTRLLTVLWTALLATMAVIATALAAAGLHAWWALFTGVISYVLLAVMFFGEYMFRRWRFADHRHAHPIQMVWFIVKAGPIWLRRT
jgi:uncharacterized membrane protein